MRNLSPRDAALASLSFVMHLLVAVPADLEAQYFWDDIFRDEHQLLGGPFAIPPSSNPGPKHIWDNRVFFAAERPTIGRELFWTMAVGGDYPFQGYPKGYDEVTPGSVSSNPANFINHCGRMFFTADRVIDGTLYPQVLNTLGPGADVEIDYWDDLEQDGFVFWNVEQPIHWNDEMWFIAEGFSPRYGATSRYAWRIYNPAPDQCVTEMVMFEPLSSGRVPDVRELEATDRGVAMTVVFGAPAFGSAPMDIVVTAGEPWNTTTYVTGAFSAAELTFEALTEFLFYRIQGPDLDPILQRVDLNGLQGVATLTFPDGAGVQPEGVLELLAADGYVYFSATNLAAGREIWRSGGFVADTELVEDVKPGTPGSNPFDFRHKGNFVYFLTDGASPPWEDGLFRARIALNQTVRLATVENPNNLTLLAFGGQFYFAGTIEDRGQEVWTSDGTASGTWPCLDVDDGQSSSAPNFFIRYYNDVLFSADESDLGRELVVALYKICEAFDDDPDDGSGGGGMGTGPTS